MDHGHRRGRRARYGWAWAALHFASQWRSSPTCRVCDALDRSGTLSSVAATLLPAYEIGPTVGVGGYAEVRLAYHRTTGSKVLPTGRTLMMRAAAHTSLAICRAPQVAVKLIKHMPADAAFMTRLAREVTIMRVLNHPNIVRLADVVATDEYTALVMNFAEGESLDECVFEGHGGRLAAHVARFLFRQVKGVHKVHMHWGCDDGRHGTAMLTPFLVTLHRLHLLQLLGAVDYCHHQGIVHRDLKMEVRAVERPRPPCSCPCHPFCWCSQGCCSWRPLRMYAQNVIVSAHGSVTLIGTGPPRTAIPRLLLPCGC